MMRLPVAFSMDVTLILLQNNVNIINVLKKNMSYISSTLARPKFLSHHTV
jgi:hypothetical protein